MDIDQPAADLAQHRAVDGAAVDARDAAPALGVDLAREDQLRVLVPQAIFFQQRLQIGAIHDVEDAFHTRTISTGPHKRRVGTLAT